MKKMNISPSISTIFRRRHIKTNSCLLTINQHIRIFLLYTLKVVFFMRFVIHACNPTYAESRDRRIILRLVPKEKLAGDPI
jgi:hypothetical protein